LFRASVAASKILTLRYQLTCCDVNRRATNLQQQRRLAFAGCIGWHLGARNALEDRQAETVIRWHRAGFRAYLAPESRTGAVAAKETPAGIVIHSQDDLATHLGAPRNSGELLSSASMSGKPPLPK